MVKLLEIDYSRSRIAADRALTRMLNRDLNDDYYTLAKLLGHPDLCGQEWCEVFTDEDKQACDRLTAMLSGPHGRSILKALCIQKGLTDLSNTCADS